MMTETERRLVAALQVSASVIVDDAAPPFEEVVSLRTDRRHGWRRSSMRTLAGAAAIVLGIVVLAIVVHKAAKPRPANPFHGLSCTVPLPSAWTRAISAGTVSLQSNAMPMAIMPSGDVVVASTGSPETIVLVHRDGSQAKVFTVPSAFEVAGPASTDGRWLTFQIANPGNPQLRGILVLDTATSAWHIARPISTDPIIQINNPLLLDAKVYWSEGRPNNVGDTQMYAYDLSSGTRRLVSSHVFVGPFALPGAIAWVDFGATRVVRGALTLPRGMTLKDIDEDGYLAGTTFVWTRAENPGAGIYAVESHGAHRTLVYPAPQDRPTKLGGVAGQYVLIGGPLADQPYRILDLRSGASTLLPDGTTTSTQTSMGIASGNTIAFARSAPHRKTQVVILHTELLPDLHC